MGAAGLSRRLHRRRIPCRQRHQAIDSARARSSILLEPGYLAVFYPEDAHQTGLIVNQPGESLHKAVFKIRLGALR